MSAAALIRWYTHPYRYLRAMNEYAAIQMAEDIGGAKVSWVLFEWWYIGIVDSNGWRTGTVF